MFFKRLWVLFLGRWELAFKQTAWFRVVINRTEVFLIQGTVKKGTFDFELTPITVDRTWNIKSLTIMHLGTKRESSVIALPLFMVSGDTLTLTFERVIN